MKASRSLPPIIYSQHMAAAQLWRDIIDEYQIKTNRERRNVRVRQAFAVALTNETNLTYAIIGSVMNKDHSTVVHCRRCHESNMLYDDEYPGVYDLMTNRITEMVVEHSEKTIDTAKRKNFFSGKTIDNYVASIERKYQRKIEHLELGNKMLAKSLKDMHSRYDKLESEYSRIKNLL